MAEQASMSALDRWKNNLRSAIDSPKWNDYDCEIKTAVEEYNRHLGNTPGFRALDWKLIKAMVWVETGAENAEWKTKPMQIGVNGDPGLASLLRGNEGGDLIIPPLWQGRLTAGSARTIPAHNIRAGIGYLLMRMANFEHRSVQSDQTVLNVAVKAGDNLDKIAKTQGTTTEMLRKLNPTASVLRPGLALRYQKASVKRVITGWRLITTSLIAQRYNGGGDPNYARKLDFAFALLTNRKEATCG
ncbi:peptidoglycan-binding protein [Massilia sp. WF1]|uniref:LysM peptidoglycan-binding domain-containing protein n=1 Tax=unclassified Massilia TaxID=2609279 RepID=UPI00064B2300|nr:MULTISPECIES: LysM domain-containing protein [unclassified Massilia]ALK98128.1 peptidoglycan-binding protein [Massilia sp. WG5]KLU35600.1 peptidoglycan-binding protein [Massilia sp. WF1]